MKLNKITVQDFRQFMGTQTVEFAQGEKNVTIIFGVNGKGKTGIFRAMMFALFGDKFISQDNDKKSVYLVNSNRLVENQGKPTKATVTVDFNHKDYHLTIERSITATIMGDSIKEGEETVRLIEYNKLTSTEKEYQSIDDVRVRINRVLEENIREFFFFDAEKIDTLSKAQSAVKSVVKQGIIKILQIDLVEDATSSLSRSIKTMNESIKKNTKVGELRRKMESKESQEKELESLMIEKSFNEENLSEAVKQLEEFETKLKENEDIKEISDKISNYKDLRRSKYETVNEIVKNASNSYFKEFHALLLERQYYSLNEEFSLRLKDQKSFIPRNLLELTLEKHTCFLCQSDISSNEHVIAEIKKLLVDQKSTATNLFIYLTSVNISDFEQDRYSKKLALKQSIRDIEMKRSEINDIDQHIKDMQNTIASIAAKEINFSELENSKMKTEDKIGKLKTKIVINNTKIEQLEGTIKSIDKEIENLQKQDNEFKLLVNRLKYLKNLKGIFEDMSVSYCDEMRKKLMETTTDIIKELIAKEDRNIIDKVKINEKYEIEVYGWHGNEITQDISQGQRQMVSLAFISALAKLASKGQDSIDFPLFMDTPFGRVSGENRDNLIRNMPNFTSQWILLFTDTELTAAEESVFRSEGKLGKTYMLNQVFEGYTQINEVSEDQLLATRGYK